MGYLLKATFKISLALFRLAGSSDRLEIKALFLAGRVVLRLLLVQNGRDKRNAANKDSPFSHMENLYT